MIHASIGDPLPIGHGEATAAICFCACPRCMRGECCQFPPQTVDTSTRTYTSTTTSGAGVLYCGALDHDFNVLDPARLYCRKCGTTRKV